MRQQKTLRLRRADASRLVALNEPHPLSRSTLPGMGRLAWAPTQFQMLFSI